MIPSHPRHPFLPLNLLAISSFSRPCFESHARDAPLDRTRRTRIGVPSWLKRRKKEEKEKEKEKEERGTSPVRTFEDERGRTTGRKKGKKKEREIESKGSERETWKRGTYGKGRRRKGILYGKRKKKRRTREEKEERRHAEVCRKGGGRRMEEGMGDPLGGKEGVGRNFSIK